MCLQMSNTVPVVELSVHNMAKSAWFILQEPSYFTGSDVRIRDPDMSLLHFAVAFKGVSWADADSIPLMIMQQMLGGWNKNAGAGKNMASRAFTWHLPAIAACLITSGCSMSRCVTMICLSLPA
jgi:Peptidase M16 inactive domain